MLTFRPTTHQDFEFLFELLKATMQEYVAQTWGWDETWQRQHFRGRFKPGADRVIILDGEEIGVISTEESSDEIFLSKIYILPEYQRRGIGAQLIQGVLDEAASKGLPVGLRVLKVNPARGLYERLGFKIVSQTGTHYVMRATPGQSNPPGDKSAGL